MFFIDDILTFDIISRSQLSALHYIYLRYGEASRLLKNGNKSMLYLSSADRLDIESIVGIFGFQITPLEEGLTYLGYKLKSQ